MSLSADDFFFKYRYPLLIVLFGLTLIGLGVLFSRGAGNLSETKIEVLDSTTEAQNPLSDLVVEISGQVEKPGVYRLPFGSRVEDLLIAAGGLAAGADRNWVERNLNRAAKLSDGQKIYLPKQSESMSAKNERGIKMYQGNLEVTGEGLVNINTASLSQLDKLPGIGPVYGQNIIEHRPYSTIEELLSKGVLKKSVYEKIKDKITIY